MDLSRIKIPGQELDETIVMALQRHPVALARHIWVFTGGIILPAIAFFMVRSYSSWLDSVTSFFFIVFVLGVSLFYLYILLFMFHAWVDYYLDIWIVTNERIVAIEQRGLFNRVVSELRLDRIQDVSSETKGIFPTLFKYGTVEVQTASEQDKFNFSEVPHPEMVARKILELHEPYVIHEEAPQAHTEARRDFPHQTTTPSDES